MPGMGRALRIIRSEDSPNCPAPSGRLWARLPMLPPMVYLRHMRGYWMNKSFDRRLESMRGIAALTVAAHHGMSAFAGGSTPPPLNSLLFAFNPAAAVMFFFVLSGYVLGRALDRDGKIYPFLARRAFRIIPPFVFAVLFAFACVTLIRIDPAPSGLTEFFVKQFWPEPTQSQLWDNLVLASSWINGPTWSIWPELLGSASLPFLAFVHILVSRKWQWLLFLSISVALAFSALKLVIWFYLGSFLAKKIADNIGTRKWLSVVAFPACGRPGNDNVRSTLLIGGGGHWSAWGDGSRGFRNQSASFPRPSELNGRRGVFAFALLQLMPAFTLAVALSLRLNARARKQPTLAGIEIS